MRIELKKISYDERLSEETNAFSADLYIEGKKAGIASNRGYGGPTDYYADNENGKLLIQQAEAHCKTLPDIEYPNGHLPGTFSVPMSLELYIDNLLENYLSEREEKIVNRKIQKAMPDQLIWGENGKTIMALRLKSPIAMFLVHSNGPNMLSDLIRKSVMPHLKEGDTMFNTNIPDQVYQAAGLKPGQYKTYIEEPKQAKTKQIRRNR